MVQAVIELTQQEKAEKLLREKQQRFKAVCSHLTERDEMCSACVDTYRSRCNETMAVRCRASHDIRIREEYARIKPKMESGEISRDEWEIYMAHEDPVIWAEAIFGWKARWYQAEILHCSAQKKVIRAGRRIGKSWTLAVDVLHRCMTQPGSKVLVICPFESQVGIVFQVIRELIGQSDGLVQVSRDVHQPQRIEFPNGSYVLGMTAGTRTGMKGNRIRGQDATAIYLDEADYLDQPTLESLLAVFTSHPNCFFWASSTPTGERALFWEFCTKLDAHGMRAFHYKSSVSPTWTYEIECGYREMYSTAAYIHEFDAEFGDQETGIYQSHYVDASVEDYTYAQCQRKFDHGFIYSLGVDWNAHKNGVHMVVVEYNPYDKKLKTVLHESVQAQEFTQTKAIEYIIKLHEKWRFDSIYVDKGFGDMQIEQMHLYGQKHRASRMGKIVKGIAMQGNVMIRDPYTKQEVKKNAKHLMVQLSARRVEVGQCMFPRSEDSKHGLLWQLRNFKAERISRDGIPVYNTMEDHALVSWQLAIFGLIMEFTDIARPRRSSKISYADVHGTKGSPVGQEVSKEKRERVERRRRLQIIGRSADATNVRSLSDIRTQRQTGSTRQYTPQAGGRTRAMAAVVRPGHGGRYRGIGTKPVGRRTF